MSGKPRWKILIPVFVLVLLYTCREKGATDVFVYKPNIFIKNWLLAGPLPNCSNCSTVNFHHGRNCKGFYYDFLTQTEGETGTIPHEGEVVSVPGNGKTYKWFSYSSNTGKIPLNDILKPNDLVVAYAFCKVKSPRAQRSVLAVGSNDGIKVFLNGQYIHGNHPRMGRWLQQDNDLIPVQLKEGINDLLLKIDEGTGDFGFMVRFLDYDSTLASMKKNAGKYTVLKTYFYNDTLTATYGEPFKTCLLNEEGKVHLELVHEKKGKISEQQVIPGEEAVFTLAGQPDGFITVKASFRIAGDSTLTAVSHQYKGVLERHPPPSMLGENLFPTVNGKPFFPVGTYGAPPEDYGKLKKAGYNFVMASAGNLDKLEEAGLMGIITAEKKDLREFVNRYRDHPALLGWMMYDEPGYNRADILEIYNLYNTLFRLDPVHLSYLVITDPKVYTTFGRCCDILAIDTYPVQGGIITETGTNIAQARNLSGGDQPVWHCGQLFAWPGQRMPDIREHRFMTYLALINGAKGLLWYTYKGYGQYLPEKDPELWEAHKNLLREIRELETLFINGQYTDIHTMDENLNIAGAMIGTHAEKIIVAVNQSKTDTLSPVFIMDDTFSGMLNVIGENRNINAVNGRFTDHFDPLDVHIYRRLRIRKLERAELMR